MSITNKGRLYYIQNISIIFGLQGYISVHNTSYYVYKYSDQNNITCKTSNRKYLI